MARKKTGHTKWQKHIENYHELSISQKEYCLQNNLNYATFNHWKRHFDRECKKEITQTAELCEVAAPLSSTVLLKSTQQSTSTITVKANNGVEVLLPSNISTEILSAVISHLGSVICA